MTRSRIAFGTLLLLSTGGCTNAPAAIKKNATWLCMNGQLDRPKPPQLQPDTAEDAKNYIAGDDLEFVAAAAKVDETPETLEALKIVVPVAAAFNEAMAKHTTCDVAAPVVSGATATVAVTQTRPTIAGELRADLMDALEKAESKADKVALLEKTIAEHGTPETRTVTVKFVKANKGAWLASFGLGSEPLKAP